ncbi:enoyl-CoA hydratase/isomerase family protein [Ideonella sp. A 288]|uniref:enoyl-CoA hydratase/isomerase family protein n=1 Tax=Ideonella sp. A 288 TaxID=1962181 RepID=UPI001F37D8CA|nr:enoyl-CoA hydratase/isomerase family protein [Ideonella sp. A 288]
MDYRHLIVEPRGAADWVTLNRPEQLNTLTAESLAELNHYFDSLLDNAAVRVVVLRGAGRAFCAGLDIKAATVPGAAVGRTTDLALQSQRRFSGLVMRMRRCPQPVIGLIHGHAAGGGFSIALGCDVRIAAEGAKMNCAFIKIGLSGCEMGASYHLSRLVGTSVAAELLYTGRFIDAQRALRVGLVSDVVPLDQLEAAGQSLADDMLATAPLGLRLSKECFWAAVDGNDLPSVIAMEDRNQVLTIANGDLDEGMRAFVEKRRPRFGG